MRRATAARNGPHFIARLAAEAGVKVDFNIGDEVRIIKTGERTRIRGKSAFGGDFLLEGHPGKQFPSSSIKPVKKA